MDAATRRSMTITLVSTLVLTLVVLGFAAMSTSPPFVVPSWLPYAFFVAALVVALGGALWFIVSLVRNKAKRIGIANRLSGLYLEGEDVKSKFKAEGSAEDAIILAQEWSHSVDDYFRVNPDELGTARLISLRPRQSDWLVYSQFDPFGEGGKQSEKYYAFRDVSIKMEKLLDLITEFLR